MAKTTSLGMKMTLDKQLADVITGAVNDYVAGRPWTAVSFDIMRVGDEMSMESVFMLLMNQDDWKTISLMMKVINHPDKDVKSRVYEAIVTAIEAEK